MSEQQIKESLGFVVFFVWVWFWFVFFQQHLSKKSEMLVCLAVTVTVHTKSCWVGWIFAGSDLQNKRPKFFEWKFNEMTQTNTALS